MDFNNVKFRLERIYSSINERFKENLEDLIEIKTKSNGFFHTYEISFSKGQSDAKTANQIMMIIYNIASLKDHLKNKLRENKKVIETEIKKSLHLQIILDLVNPDKHGYPATKHRHSKKDPIIKNVRHSMKLSTSGKSSSHFMINPFTGDFETQGDCTIMIDADIVDKNGDQIFTLNELVSGAIAKWEEIIKKYNIN